MEVMADLVVIDGSIGYGQVLRSAVSLSALTGTPIRITNIRQGRPKPGLMPQHLAGVKVAADFCGAELRGAQYGSMQLDFVPGSLRVSDRRIDIGTAGSIGLLLQTVLPIILFADKPTTLEVTGGTAGLGAPTAEYIMNVTLPMLAKFGIEQPEMRIVRQGFYPRGGGIVSISSKPAGILRHTMIERKGTIKAVRGISIAGGLPSDVAARQADAARDFLAKSGVETPASIDSFSYDTLSQGTSITLFEQSDEGVLGSDAIGRRGLRAEEVGREAASSLLVSMRSGAALDRWMADQIIPFMALAMGKSSVTVEKITDHCRTNMFVCEKMLGVKFLVEGGSISCEGIGFRVQ